VEDNGQSGHEVDQTGRAELPPELYPTKLDDKGRLKVPGSFLPYFESLMDKEFFITSMDYRQAQVYPMSEWRATERFLNAFRQDPEVGQQALFIARDLGGRATLDANGRLLFPTTLRRELGMENRPIYLHARKGRIFVMSESVYLEQKGTAKAAAFKNNNVLEQAGLP
jgi:transcriptional regulator MraZ